MRRRSAALGLGVALAVCATAAAGDADFRAAARDQLSAELAAAQRARAAVDDKVATASADRARRVRAAYKLLRAGTAPAWLDPDERMAAARRRAAVRYLLARDRAELGLLADERDQLAAAEGRLTADLARTATLPLPARGLAWPTTGGPRAVVAGFGPYLHETSGASLSRRGIELRVAAGSEVRAMADGLVRYAGPIRGLDTGVVVDHGTCLTVIGGLAELRQIAGAAVHRGDLLGGAAGRHIYVEVRLPVGAGGVPVDPLALLAPR